MKLSRKLTIFIGISVVLVVLAAITIPATTTDGTRNYTGIKLEAARNALQFDQSEYSPALFSSRTKAHVDNVVPTPQGKDSQGKALRCTDDLSSVQYYSVIIRRVGLFGTTYGRRVYNLCKIAG
jgi:hypothetical protein